MRPVAGSIATVGGSIGHMDQEKTALVFDKTVI